MKCKYLFLRNLFEIFFRLQKRRQSKTKRRINTFKTGLFLMDKKYEIHNKTYSDLSKAQGKYKHMLKQKDHANIKRSIFKS